MYNLYFSIDSMFGKTPDKNTGDEKSPPVFVMKRIAVYRIICRGIPIGGCWLLPCMPPIMPGAPI